MHPNEQGDTCAGFLTRALAWFAAHDVTVERVIPDNAPNYRRSRAFQQVMTDAGIRHLRTRPYRPQTNGKAERFNQTLLHEWAYETTWTTNPPATLSALRCRTVGRHRYRESVLAPRATAYVASPLR